MGTLLTILLDPADSSNLLPNPPSRTSKKRKRELEEIITEIANIEKEKEFQPLQLNERAPQLRLPPNINMEDLYSLFTLFFTEEIFEMIAHSTNIYAELNRVIGCKSKKTKEIQDIDLGRAWKDTNEAEIKVFFAILIYMGLYNSNRINLYWRNDQDQGPIHTPQLYMTQNILNSLRDVSISLIRETDILY